MARNFILDPTHWPSVVAIPLVAFHRSTATERVIRSAKLSVKEPGEHSVSEA